MIAIEILIAALVALATPADALRETAPRYLTTESAIEHRLAAGVAAAVYELEPELLLSIAHHESRYSHTEVTREAGGTVSCGVMTPEPTRDRALCAAATSSPLAGYLHGAQHLRGWLVACRGRRTCALLGYAGGFYLIRACADDPSHKACGIPAEFDRRARWIRAKTLRTLSRERGAS